MLKRALISVSNKEGIVEFARGLVELGVELISTGGTADLLHKNGIPVKQVSEVVGFPEILDGRVKTLQPKIHGGILAIRSNPEHMRQLAEHDITPIDMVVVNLYPFRETVSKPGVSLAEAVENIDIGGPAMVRAAAKNYQDVIIIVEPYRYEEVLADLRERGDVAPDKRLVLAVEAFRHTAWYDSMVSQYLGEVSGQGLLTFPGKVTFAFEKVQALRYGENPHQAAAFYREPLARGVNIANSKQLHGKELSFNNINDANAALELVQEFEEIACVAIKHTNPCGVGIGTTILEAYQRAYEGDPVSIFGGIVAFNRKVDKATAEAMMPVFLEIILAPEFDGEALEVLKKKKDVRLLETGYWTGADASIPYDIKKVGGGLLLQTADVEDADPAGWKVVTQKTPTQDQLKDLQLAWKIVKHVKSNAIVLVRDHMAVGIGAGQTNRIDAARHAIRHAGEKVKGSVLASDAFFPFPDVVEAAAEAGVVAIVQPGGSLRDDESVKMADEKGLAMVFTGFRHFKH